MSDDDVPRLDYLQALVTAYNTVSGHRAQSRYRNCRAENKRCMDTLTVGTTVISRG